MFLVIDLRFVVEGVRVAERRFPATQPVAEALLQRGGRSVESSAELALWKHGCWQELSGENWGQWQGAALGAHASPWQASQR